MTGIVITHGAASEATNRHLPNWMATFDQVILVSPFNDPFPGSCLIGDSCRHGRGTMERMLFACVMASRFPVAAVLEYDTLIFKDTKEMLVPDMELHCSELFHSDDERFSAKTYPHSPWMATGETWWKIVTAPAGFQNGNPDRWLADACGLAGVAMFGTTEGFSSDREWTKGTIRKAALARGRGAVAIHGVKTREAFDALS